MGSQDDGAAGRLLQCCNAVSQWLDSRDRRLNACCFISDATPRLSWIEPCCFWFLWVSQYLSLMGPLAHARSITFPQTPVTSISVGIRHHQWASKSDYASRHHPPLCVALVQPVSSPCMLGSLPGVPCSLPHHANGPVARCPHTFEPHPWILRLQHEMPSSKTSRYQIPKWQCT